MFAEPVASVPVISSSNHISTDQVDTETQTHNIEQVKKTEIARSQSYINANPLCKLCGQRHRLSENHEYDYAEVRAYNLFHRISTTKI